MKKKTKIIILILLFVILVYIWWGNIKLFQNSVNYSISPKESTTTNYTLKTKRTEIKYNKPKLNPFKRYLNSKKINSTINQKIQTQKLQPKISSKYHLTGFVMSGQSPQAIINFENKTYFLSLADSLEHWELIELDETLTIFKHEDQKDTIFLSK